MANWDSVLVAMNTSPSEDILKHLFYNQIRYSQVLRSEIEHYHRLPVGHKEKSYAFLVQSVRSLLERKLREVNRNAVSSALSGSDKTPAAPAKGGGRGRGRGKGKGGRSRSPSAKGEAICYQFEREGKCDRADCKYKHVKGGGKSHSPSKGRGKKGKAGNRSRSPSPTGIPCQFFLSGHCKFADKCWNKHEGKPTAPASSPGGQSAKAKKKAAKAAAAAAKPATS